MDFKEVREIEYPKKKLKKRIAENRFRFGNDFIDILIDNLPEKITRIGVFNPVCGCNTLNKKLCSQCRFDLVNNTNEKLYRISFLEF